MRLFLLIVIVLFTMGVASAETFANESQQAGAISVTLEEITTLETSPISRRRITEVTHAQDGRLFIVQQSGRIFIYNAGTLLPTPFLDISTEVATCNECGLLGLAFHPDYATNGYFYVNYSDSSGNDTIIERFQVDPSDANLATKVGRQVVIEIDQPYSNHNSGPIKFGPDGYLYISTGDGGGGGDPDETAQNPQSLLGKMLRLDVTGVMTYTIPADNPFVGDPTVRDEIWATGLRNPWRFDFDSQTGGLWLADVGQYTNEEINVQAASSTGGENYGWDCREGFDVYPNKPWDTADSSPLCPDDTSAFKDPVYDYPHSGAAVSGCSVTGGQVYRGNWYPEFQGLYFFADYCTRALWTLTTDPPAPTFGATTATVPGNPTTFGSDSRGEMYVGNDDGEVFRITNGTPLAVGLRSAETTTAWPLLLATLAVLAFATWRLQPFSTQLKK